MHAYRFLGVSALLVRGISLLLLQYVGKTNLFSFFFVHKMILPSEIGVVVILLLNFLHDFTVYISTLLMQKEILLTPKQSKMLGIKNPSMHYCNRLWYKGPIEPILEFSLHVFCRG